jgi:putative effector of murein hydrolase LrgA (UPF0299 family)
MLALNKEAEAMKTLTIICAIILTLVAVVAFVTSALAGSIVGTIFAFFCMGACVLAIDGLLTSI